MPGAEEVPLGTVPSSVESFASLPIGASLAPGDFLIACARSSFDDLNNGELWPTSDLKRYSLAFSFLLTTSLYQGSLSFCPKRLLPFKGSNELTSRAGEIVEELSSKVPLRSWLDPPVCDFCSNAESCFGPALLSLAPL